MDTTYTSMNEGSIPINIPTKIPTKIPTYTLSEYNIKQNFFNPNKRSPPTFFTQKLEARIHNYYKKFT